MAHQNPILGPGDETQTHRPYNTPEYYVDVYGCTYEEAVAFLGEYLFTVASGARECPPQP